MRIKIGVDIDGVIANFIRKFSLASKIKFGNHVPLITDKIDITTWNFSFLNITEEQAEEVFNDIKNSDCFWLNMQVVDVEQWRDFLLEFNNKNYEVYFISNRENGINLHYQTVEWLISVGWKNPQVILTKNKEDVIDALKINYFIDDKLGNCIAVYTSCDCKCYIYDYPHNRNIPIEVKDIIRVNNLTEFKEHILNNLKKLKMEKTNEPLNTGIHQQIQQTITDDFENHVQIMLNLINSNENVFVSNESCDMKYVCELEKRNLIKTNNKLFGKVCNSIL